jgi:hypothetical protein
MVKASLIQEPSWEGVQELPQHVLGDQPPFLPDYSAPIFFEDDKRRGGLQVNPLAPLRPDPAAYRFFAVLDKV